MKRRIFKKSQEGSILLEALIAVVIFSIGILGMVATLVRATANVTDTRQRDEVFLAASTAFHKVQFYNNAGKDITSSMSSDVANQFDFSKQEIAATKNCAGKTTSTGTIYANNVSYGVRKAGESKDARKVEFCSYHDTGPVR